MKFYEGVAYYRFAARYTLTDGRRRRRTIWAPALCYAAESFDRWVAACDIAIKAGSNVHILPCFP